MRTLRTLIARLGDPSEVIVTAAQKALVVLTGQDFGFAARKWETWAEQASGNHRVEWLVDALGQQDEALRALAGEELKQLTQQYFGYHPALPKKDRELAQRKYREWWEREGARSDVHRAKNRSGDEPADVVEVLVVAQVAAVQEIHLDLARAEATQTAIEKAQHQHAHRQ